MKKTVLNLVFIPSALFIVLTFLIAYTLTTFINLNDHFHWYLAISYTLSMILTVFLTTKIFGIKIFLRENKIRPSTYILIISTYFFLLFSINLFLSFFDVPEDFLQTMTDLIKRSPVVAFMVLVVAAPVLEEILFRRIILHFLLKKINPINAILISSLAFGLIHMNLWQGIAAFVMGMYFGYVYWKTKSLKTVVLLHLITNFLGFVSFYSMENNENPVDTMSTQTKSVLILIFFVMFYLLFQQLKKSLNTYPSILYVATQNPHKLNEIRNILPSVVQIESLEKLGHNKPLQENGNTLEENSRQKAMQIVTTYGVDVIADDTGLEVEALDGQPGVFSARFAGEQATDAQNRQKLLKMLENQDNRNARFRTVITLSLGNLLKQFEGEIQGIIANEEKGSGGFGYDSIFIPSGYEKRFSEMTAEEKNSISHRANALKKLQTFLKHYYKKK